MNVGWLGFLEPETQKTHTHTHTHTHTRRNEGKPRSPMSNDHDGDVKEITREVQFQELSYVYSSYSADLVLLRAILAAACGSTAPQPDVDGEEGRHLDRIWRGGEHKRVASAACKHLRAPPWAPPRGRAADARWRWDFRSGCTIYAVLSFL